MSRYQNGFEVIGILGGWKIDASINTRPLTGVWLLDRPIAAGHGDTLVVTGFHDNLRRARVRVVSVSPLVPDDPKRPATADVLRAALARDDDPPRFGRAAGLPPLDRLGRRGLRPIGHGIGGARSARCRGGKNAR